MARKTTLFPDDNEIVRKVIDECKYGQSFTHDEIAAWINKDLRIEKEKKQYMQSISAANNKLIKLGKMLKNKYGEGYTVLHPNGYSSESGKFFEKSKRYLGRSFRIVNYAKLSLMSDAEKSKSERLASILGGVINDMMKTTRVIGETLNPAKIIMNEIQRPNYTMEVDET